MGLKGSRVRSPPEADTFTAVHREFVGFGTVLRCGLVRLELNKSEKSYRFTCDGE